MAYRTKLLGTEIPYFLRGVPATLCESEEQIYSCGKISNRVDETAFGKTTCEFNLPSLLIDSPSPLSYTV